MFFSLDCPVNLPYVDIIVNNKKEIY